MPRTKEQTIEIIGHIQKTPGFVGKKHSKTYLESQTVQFCEGWLVSVLGRIPQPK